MMRQEIAGVPVAELAARFGTPLYVYDISQVAERLAMLAPFDTVRYAQKAWSHLAILDWFRRQDVLVDAVSAGEILRALAAGYPATGEPPPIVYTADLFDDDALDLVIEHDITVNCGSPDMVAQLGERAPGRAIIVRINPGFGHGHHRKTNTGGPHSKHGIWHEQLDEVVACARRYDLRIRGAHIHIGSGTDMRHLARVCDALDAAARRIGDSIDMISTGGGLPIPYHTADPECDVEQFYELWAGVQARLEKAFGHPVRLETEPGRYLVAEAGYLIAQIRSVKEMGPNLFYLVDAGFHALARPVLYGAYHPISVVHRRPVGEQVSMESVIVGGPLCESGDIFTQDEGGFVSHRALPRAEPGDWIVIEKAGAYGSVMASRYNSQPLPAEVWIEAGRAELIRPREPLESLYATERLPGRNPGAHGPTE